MPEKEATARVTISKLLEAAGWRFFPDGSAPACRRSLAAASGCSSVDTALHR
jgi:hypothetical protein